MGFGNIHLTEETFSDPLVPIWTETKVFVTGNNFSFTLDLTEIETGAVIPKGAPIQLDYTTGIAYLVPITGENDDLFNTGTPTARTANALIHDKRETEGAVSVTGVFGGSCEFIRGNMPYDASSVEADLTSRFFFVGSYA